MKDNIKEGWTYDKIAFYTPSKDTIGAIPVYEYYFDQKKTYGGVRFNYSTNSNLG